MSARQENAKRTPYDVLDCDIHATNAQIRDAYQRAVQLIDGDNVAGYAMLDEEAQREARAEIEEAYALLGDPAERSAYDASIGSSPPKPASDAAEKPGAKKALRFLRPIAQGPPEARAIPSQSRKGFSPIELGEDETIDGARVREIRELRKLSLEDIAKQTRVRVKYLKAIESEDFDNLPERVFLRGFLTQIGRVLKVDRTRLADRYCYNIALKRSAASSEY